MSKLSSQKSKTPKLGILSLAMINMAIMISIQAIPERAEYGYTIIFYTTIICVCFFIPLAMVASELASGWPKKGGVFLWVTEAFGPKWGFVATFMQWVENLVLFPVILAFMATALAYLIDPSLDTNKLFILTIIWVSIWISTFLNFWGMKLSSFCSSSGAILGKIIPAFFLIALGIMHVVSEKPLAIEFSPSKLIPKESNLDQLLLLAGVVLSLTGIEMSAVHITNTENPKKNFTRAIFIACIITIFVAVVAPLSISIVVPIEKINLSSGVMQGFEALFSFHEKKWATPLVAILLSYGVLASTVTIMVAASRAIREAARKGYLPQFMQKDNKYGMPVGILITQAAISSILSLVILFMPTVSGAFWIMTDLAAQLYLVMYILIFAAAIKLRYSQPNTERPFKIPCGKVGIWVVSGIALLTSFLVIILGFIPTAAIREKGILAMTSYVAFLLAGIILFTATPIILYHKSQKS